jgi:hypothetical protein
VPGSQQIAVRLFASMIMANARDGGCSALSPSGMLSRPSRFIGSLLPVLNYICQKCTYFFFKMNILAPHLNAQI